MAICLNYPEIVFILSAICALLATGFLIKGNPGNCWSMLAISLAGLSWYFALYSMDLFSGNSANCWSILEIRPFGFTWNRPLQWLNQLFPATPLAALDPAALTLLVLSILTAFMGWEKRDNSLRLSGVAFASFPIILLTIWLVSMTYPNMIFWFSAIGFFFAIGCFIEKFQYQGFLVLIVSLAGFVWLQTGVVNRFNCTGPLDLVFDPTVLSLYVLCLISTFLGWQKLNNLSHREKVFFLLLSFFLGIILPVIIGIHNAPPRLMF